MISAPGLYVMKAEVYHEDRFLPAPSLSNSIARLLVTRSPAHAWTAHARLNPDYVAEEKKAFDRGSASHALLLEGEDRMVPVDADDWRKKVAQEARDDARAAGKHPVLRVEYDAAFVMREVMLKAIANCDDLSGINLARDGVAEQVMVWKESGGVWCRARPDWRQHDGRVFFDYKTTATSAHPDAWVKTMAGMQGEMQGAFYLRGNYALGGPVPADTKFVFGVQENEPPYAVCFIGLKGQFIELGAEKVEEAVRMWRYCTENDSWPAYTNRICWVEPPAWVASAWATRSDGATGIPYDVAKLWAKDAPREGDPIEL